MNNAPPARPDIVAYAGRAQARPDPGISLWVMARPLARRRRVGRLQFPMLVALALALVLFVWVPPALAGSAATGGQWSWPLGGQPEIVHRFDLPSQPWLAGHRGVDLRASPGQLVRAAGAGTVTFAGWVGGLPAVTVAHPRGLRTTYQPVVASVSRGEKISRGSTLGRVSAAGSHCLPLACLHWGLLRADAYLDPLSLVGADSQVRLLPLWTGSARAAGLGAAVGRFGQAPVGLGSPLVLSPESSHAAAPGSPGSGSRSRLPAARLGALNRARARPTA